jgi:uncharacterized protein
MSRFRFQAVIAAAFFLSTQAVAAQPVTPPAAAAAVPDQCVGKDMLAELAVSDAVTHRKIMDEAGKVENTEALLWKIEKDGVPTSHLFGTIHMADTRVTTLPEAAKQVFSKAKTVALEIANTSDAGMIEAMTKVPELLAYTDGTTLQAQLSPAEFTKVTNLVGKTGMPGEAATVIRPWMISILLAMSDCQRLQMTAGKKALDSQLEDTAKKNGATVVGLETAESQMTAMASIPNDKQILLLKAGLAYADRTDDMIETLIQLYLSRKLGATMPFQIALGEKVGIPAKSYEDFTRILVTERNAKMRDATKPLLDKGDAFIAVGALHLSGKTGLVQLLREAGYKVTAVE